MAIIPVPTLSLAGWVTSPSEKADALISHFYASEKSQTYLYGNSVTNLQWIIEQHSGDITNLVAALREALQNYLRKYYEAAIVEVTSNDNPSNFNGEITLSIYCQVTEEGKIYSIGKLLNISNNKIGKIIALNNTGVLS